MSQGYKYNIKEENRINLKKRSIQTWLEIVTRYHLQLGVGEGGGEARVSHYLSIGRWHISEKGGEWIQMEACPVSGLQNG